MKTALITGGSAGIGKVTTRALARQGYKLFVLARNQEKGNKLVQEVTQETPSAEIEFFSVDLSDFPAVKAFVKELRTKTDHLDLMVLNAGLFTPRLKASAAGHESMFATTHLGHFLLTHELLPLIKAGSDPRIVVTSSVAHHLGTLIDFFKSLKSPSPNKGLMLNSFANYGRSKLANLLFVRELAERLKEDGVLVNAFHPGGVRTEIWRGTPTLLKLINMFLITEEKGADTQIFLSVDPGVIKTGRYWCRRKIDFSHPKSKDKKLIKTLWQYSEEALAIDEFGRPDML